MKPKEFYEGLFDLSFMTHEEQETIFTATELFAKGVINSLKPTDEEINSAIKELSKQSTAPDKETPDWMETDIRRGIEWGIKRMQGNPPSQVLEG